VTDDPEGLGEATDRVLDDMRAISPVGAGMVMELVRAGWAHGGRAEQEGRDRGVDGDETGGEHGMRQSLKRKTVEVVRWCFESIKSECQVIE
jgi:hypothetical protein